jgi:hypothetical protein
MGDQAVENPRKRFDWKGMDRRDRQAIGLLLLIVLLGTGLRFRGITWSLPDVRHPLATYHPDERVNLNAALQADIAHGQFDIKFYNYGTLYFYLVNLAQTIGAGYGVIPKLPAGDAAPDALLAGQAATNAGLFLAGRVVSALFGIATLPALFALGRRTFGRKAGLLAALLYAVAPLAVLHAHFLTVDVTSTFFVTLTLLWSARLLTSQTWSNYALAAIWAGLAAATKYNAGIVIVAPIAAHFLNRDPNACRTHRGGQFVVLIAVTMLTFLIACPGPWLNLDAFWNGIEGYPGSGLRYELFEHSRSGHGYLFTDTGNGWWYHLAVSLPFGLGPVLLFTGLLGLVPAFRQRTKSDIVLLAFLLVYYGLSGFSNVRFARYMLPLFPVFSLFAARFLTTLRLPKAAEAAACALVPLLTLYGSFYLVTCMTFPGSTLRHSPHASAIWPRQAVQRPRRRSRASNSSFPRKSGIAVCSRPPRTMSCCRTSRQCTPTAGCISKRRPPSSAPFPAPTSACSRLRPRWIRSITARSSRKTSCTSARPSRSTRAEPLPIRVRIDTDAQSA